MLDLGDTVTLAAPTVLNAAGVAANADTVTLVVTLPGGTSAAQSPGAPAQVGVYTHPYVVTQHGLHRFRWTFTGTVPDQAYADAFNVANPDWPALVGLAEVRRHLKIPASDTTGDEELRGLILSASEVATDIVGEVARQERTETYSGGDPVILLRHRPVISVTSIVIDGTTVDAGDYTVSPSGILAHRWRAWPRGFRNVSITYTAGRAATPASVEDAVKELIRINWRPHQAGNYSPFDGGAGDDFGAGGLEGSLQGEIRLGFFVPNTVMQRLMPHGRGPHIA